MIKLVWLAPPSFTGGLLSLANRFIDRVKIPRHQVRFAELTRRHYITKGKKNKRAVNPLADKEEFFAELRKLNPEFVVINDMAALSHLTGGKYQSLALCRGGVYIWEGIPCIVIDSVQKVKSMKTGNWIMLQDMLKLRRWMDGKQRQEPKFNYTVCQSVDDVKQFRDVAVASRLVALDIETTGTTITCISYACWQVDNTIRTFVVPFYSSVAERGCFWQDSSTEVQVWEIVREVHASSVPKCMQNGSYDNTYFTVYRIPLNNYTLDTLHLWHSIWCEAPKRLDFISSIALDFYRYWKDEGKEDENDEVKGGAVPGTLQGMKNYWLYNALDSHNTLLACKWLVGIIMQEPMDWARQNYYNEFTRQFGPCFAMSMRGMRLDQRVHGDLMMDETNNYITAQRDLETMIGDPNFNPGSSHHVAKLVYDVLKADPLPREGRTADEKALKIIATQHPLFDIIINQIWDVKKPLNNVSKYSDGISLNGRLMYKLYAAGTPTGRLSSKQHDLWIGTNAQNLPRDMRVMLVADPGYVLVEIDYAQSDAYFTAFTSEDERFIETMTSGKDTHCVHGDLFFKVGYDRLLAAHEAGEDWADHPTRGIRQITKRVVYGANYLMVGYTLFVTMGREAVVAAAIHLGYEDAESWPLKKLVELCTMFLQAYHDMYPGIQLTLQEDLIAACANSNRSTCAFGLTRLFFADLKNDKKAQRDFAAFHGQGGTGGNMNKSMDTIFWELERDGVMMMNQVHDSLLLQVPERRLDLVPKLMTAMMNECDVKGRRFVVPVDAKIGRRWGKKPMLSWYTGITLDEIDAHERKWLQDWEDKHSQSQFAHTGS